LETELLHQLLNDFTSPPHFAIDETEKEKDTHAVIFLEVQTSELIGIGIRKG
jgi:hypothetical protein